MLFEFERDIMFSDSPKYCTLHVYDEIDDGFVKYLISRIKNFSQSKQPIYLTLNISTHGGYLEPALSLVEVIKSYPWPVRAIGGSVSSSAVVIYAACPNRVIWYDGRIEAHNAFYVDRNGRRLKPRSRISALALQNLNAAQARVIALATGQLEDSISQLLDIDVELSPTDAAKIGFADIVVTDPESKFVKAVWRPDIFWKQRIKNYGSRCTLVVDRSIDVNIQPYTLVPATSDSY